MAHTEEEVFFEVTRHLEDKGWRFLVDCNYERILEQYNRYSMILPGRSKPDILGFTSQGQMFAVEVKGNGTTEIKQGSGQASEYRRGVQLSYLAADWGDLKEYASDYTDIGAIGVSGGEVVDWREPNRKKLFITSPDIRSNLEYQLFNRDSISKIASLNLAHPVNFLAPVLGVGIFGRSMNQAQLTGMLESEYDMSGGSLDHMIDAGQVLGLLEGSDQYRITEHGQVAFELMNHLGWDSLQKMVDLKAETSDPNTLYSIEPSLAIFLRDRYLEHQDFRALLEILRDFPQNRPTTLVEISRRLIREHPNTFLHLFCTNREESINEARNLIRSHNIDKITDDLDVFRTILRQNIYQNFTRQLKHLGVLSQQTNSTTKKLENYHPEDYPWYPDITDRYSRLSEFGGGRKT